MKNLLFIIALLFLAITSEGQQIISSSKATLLKSKKIIVALKEYPKKATETEKMMIDSANASLRFAAEHYWTFSEIIDYQPLSVAKKMVSKNKELLYLTIGQGTSTMKQGGIRYISYAETLSLYSNSGAPIWLVYLPYYESTMTHATAIYAVMQLNRIFDLLDQKVLANTLNLYGYFKKNGPKTINKTLLIPDYYISPKLSEDEVRLAYPYDLEICDISKVENAILSKDPKYVVVYYVVVPAGGKIKPFLYLSNTEDGDVYGFSDGSNVMLNLGFITIGGGQNKKYLINKKELREIGDIVK